MTGSELGRSKNRGGRRKEKIWGGIRTEEREKKK
jgi:hypothetical protein